MTRDTQFGKTDVIAKQGKSGGGTHTTVSGLGGRISWDTDANGNLVGEPHFTDQNAKKTDTKGRHPFGR